MDAGRAEIGSPRGILADRLAQALELAAPHVRQAHALGSGRGRFVEEHRDAELVADAASDRARDRRALVERDALDRHERHDVGGAHARMLAAMTIQIDLLGRALHRAEGRLHHRLGLAGEREDRAVVIGVHLVVEEHDARRGGDRLEEGLDDLTTTTFGKIGNAFDDARHQDLGRAERFTATRDARRPARPGPRRA